MKVDPTMMQTVAKLTLLLSLVATAWATVTPYDPYFEEAGRYYNIPPILLKKIAAIESSYRPNAICRNKNGTVDYGLMQINSIHLRRLAQWGINEKNILDPKINIFAGSWLLSEHIRNHGFSLEGIGNYHSATPEHKKKWLERLIGALRQQ